MQGEPELLTTRAAIGPGGAAVLLRKGLECGGFAAAASGAANRRART